MDASHLILSLTSEYVYVYVVHGEIGAHREMERAVRGLAAVCHILLGIFCLLATSKKICQVKKELISNSLA